MQREGFRGVNKASELNARPRPDWRQVVGVGAWCLRNGVMFYEQDGGLVDGEHPAVPARDQHRGKQAVWDGRGIECWIFGRGIEKSLPRSWHGPWVGIERHA